MDRATRIGLGIVLSLALSAVAVVVIVVVMGAPIWTGLVLLAVLDVAIIVGGYIGMRKAIRQAHS